MIKLLLLLLTTGLTSAVAKQSGIDVARQGHSSLVSLSVPGKVRIVGNRLQPGGQSVATVAQLQALLDANPNTVFDVRHSYWEIDRDDPKSIWLHDNRTLMMDSETVIVGTTLMPLTNKAHEGGGALLTISGNNVSLVGGRFEQDILQDCIQTKTQPTPGACNFAIDIYFSSGVLFRDTVVQGSFMSAVRVQEGFWPPAGKAPMTNHWSTLGGLAKQPVFITNVTLLHHANESFFQLRGFWTVMAMNVIFSRNTILGPFGYSIDLDSSSSANLITNNYMKGCVWEGIFTEYSAVNNVIMGNTIVANVTYNQGIHINGYLNAVVDNTVLLLDGVTPGGIACTSQLKMYGSYSLSNRILGNTVGHLALGGDGGCDNYLAENSANTSVAGATSPDLRYWFKRVPNATSDCIVGVDTTLPSVISDVTFDKANKQGTNPFLTKKIVIVGNRLQPGGQSVATVAQLQALLDANPNTVFDVRHSYWEIDRDDPKSIWLHDNRTLMMDSETVISNSVLMPSTEVKRQQGHLVTGYGALVTVVGNNIGVVGGRFEQQNQSISCNCCRATCNFAIDIYRSSGVKIRDSVVHGSFASSVRVQSAYGSGITPDQPPTTVDWATLGGIARQPVFITNVTLIHHNNESLFQLRGFWTVMAQNVIFTRNTVLGPFMYSIDLDSSSSANIVHNNYMEGPIWEGIFTEYSAVGNIITGNTVVGKVANQAHIHINGALNLVVDNTVRINQTLPGGIMISSSISMYNSYALSNRIVGNSAGLVTIQGDGGCDNYATSNVEDVTAAGSKPAVFNLWQKFVPNASQDCIAGVDSTWPAVIPPPPRLQFVGATDEP